ncbi:MAG TPA: hypothetical protein VHW00_15380 [Thermoanaerobaculia bacterium]|nr:hypothetical protein [Thermoanaerobaculia bacterium]
MDQNDSNWNSGSNNVSPGGFGTNSGGTTGATGSGTSSFSTGSTGSGSMGSGGSATGFNVGSASDTDATGSGVCATCGQSLHGSSGLEQFLGRLGITEDMVSNLKGQFQNVDIDEYLNTARDYLKDGSTRATSYAKENPGKVAAGVAALALGAGLIFAAVNRDRA